MDHERDDHREIYQRLGAVEREIAVARERYGHILGVQQKILKLLEGNGRAGLGDRVANLEYQMEDIRDERQTAKRALIGVIVVGGANLLLLVGGVAILILNGKLPWPG